MFLVFLFFFVLEVFGVCDVGRRFASALRQEGARRPCLPVRGSLAVGLTPWERRQRLLAPYYKPGFERDLGGIWIGI